MRPYRELFEDARDLTEEWAEPYTALQRSSDESATAYAQLVIQSLIIIHGGALVAIPAWWQVHHQSEPSVLAVAAFVAGLVLAVLAGALGFHALSTRSKASAVTAGEAVHRAWAHLYKMELVRELSQPEEQEVRRRIAAAEQAADTERVIAREHSRNFRMLQNAAIVAVWVSLILFLAGAGLSAGSMLISNDSGAKTDKG